MQEIKEKEVNNLQYIGKINIEQFKGITDKKLLTDEVILTDKQIEHIAAK